MNQAQTIEDLSNRRCRLLAQLNQSQPKNPNQTIKGRQQQNLKHDELVILCQ